VLADHVDRPVGRRDARVEHHPVSRCEAVDAGAERRVDRRIHDIVQDPSSVAPADVVVLHRVVCCYPDPERLVGAAATHARRLLALSFPRDTWWLRLGFRLGNVWFRLTNGFQSFVHEPARIVAAAERAGLEPLVHERSGRIWRIAIFERR
jgi:magnesium-protoporphyrin O-methyltransferase